MKNTIKVLGTHSLLCAIALVAIIGFSMAACKNDGGGGGNDNDNGPTSVTYIGNDEYGNVYQLEVSIGTTATITGYDGSGGAVTIPSQIGGKTVTSIGDMAFNDCTGLTSIIIPDSVTSIGSSAFVFCIKLASITIPNSVITIKDNVFEGCTGLTSVTFQGTIKSDNFGISFNGDLRDKFYATDETNGTPGTYTRSGTTWTKSS